MLFLALMARPGHAEFPIDPADYAQCGEPDAPELCPDDLNEEWSYLSYVPEHARSSVRAAELELGSGNRVDRAWRTTTGRFDVIVAVGDSGIQWQHSDLMNKVMVNTGELPLPQRADGTTSETYDLNEDGLVNVTDWAEDARVTLDAGRDVFRMGDVHLGEERLAARGFDHGDADAIFYGRDRIKKLQLRQQICLVAMVDTYPVEAHKWRVADGLRN